MEDLKEKNVNLNYSELENLAIVKDIKEKMCSVS
jgi:hypothetical protein